MIARVAASQVNNISKGREVPRRHPQKVDTHALSLQTPEYLSLHPSRGRSFHQGLTPSATAFETGSNRRTLVGIISRGSFLHVPRFSVLEPLERAADNAERFPLLSGKGGSGWSVDTAQGSRRFGRAIMLNGKRYRARPTGKPDRSCEASVLISVKGGPSRACHGPGFER